MAATLSLTPADVHVWAVNPEDVGADLLARYEALLSPDEEQRRERLRLERARRDYLVAHALVRAALSLYADVPPEQWIFRRNRHGRPEISRPHGVPPLRFNLSHTDGLALCAVTMNRAVGIDAEDRHRRLRFAAVAERFFAPAEVAAVGAVPEEDRRSAFFTFWTLKEAYIKAVGLGLSAGLDTFSFTLAAGGRATISFAADGMGDPRCWRFFVFRPTGRHVAALALAGDPQAPALPRLGIAVPLAPDTWGLPPTARVE